MTSHTLVWHRTAAVLADMPDVIARLLDDHHPDPTGRCVVCVAPGRGTPRALWPCSLVALATEARSIRHDASGVVRLWRTGELLGAPECSDWLVGAYRDRLPAPPRRSHFDADAADAAGLAFVGAEELGHDVLMTTGALTAYLLSQSNATSAIGTGLMTVSELRAWLHRELEPRMPLTPVSARFTVKVWCCRKA